MITAFTKEEILALSDEDVSLMKTTRETLLEELKKRERANEITMEESNKRRKQTPTNYSSSQLPNLADYTRWTKDQTRLILLDSNVGVGLDDEATMLLYNVGFDGGFIKMIVRELVRDDFNTACEQLFKFMGKVPQENQAKLYNALVLVTDWVNETIGRSNNLMRKIEELPKVPSSEQCTKFYSDTYSKLLKDKPERQVTEWSSFKKQLLELTSIPTSNVRFGVPDFGMEFASTGLTLPLYGGSDPKFAKHHLPYFSRFQYEMAKDQELLSKANQDQRNVALFMGPSGAGKTSAAIRLLCKCPGMLLTCTNFKQGSSGLTTDALMKSMHGYLSGLDIHTLFGVVDQVIHIAIICRLIYILKLIENAKENPTVFESFGGILPYLAFMQSNGKTNSSSQAFSKFINYDLTSAALLHTWSQEIIAEIISMLNDNSTKFGIASKCDKFMVVVDEANVYASSEGYLSYLIGVDGTRRGLLTNLSQIIAQNSLFHTAIFCGTNLSVDVGSIIESALCKSETKIATERYFDFGLIAKYELIPFLEKHIEIPHDEKVNFERYLQENDFKYFRRRLVTLALERLELDKHEDFSGNKLITAFEKSIKTCLEYICKQLDSYSITSFRTYRDDETVSNSLEQGIIHALINYISHYNFPFLASNFKVDNNEVANALLYSAFSGPETVSETNYIFSAKDFLGVSVANVLLFLLINQKPLVQVLNENNILVCKRQKKQVMNYVISSKIKFCIENDLSIDMKRIELLRLEEKDHKI